jgi:excisionase family DNA binding protein
MSVLRRWRDVQWLTLSEAALVLGCSPRTVYRLAESGKLRTTRDPRQRLRVRPADLEEFVDEGQPELFEVT